LRKTLRAIWISKTLLDRVTEMAEANGETTRIVFERMLAVALCNPTVTPEAQAMLDEIAKERASDEDTGRPGT
jgi:hypothetical protein